MSVIDPERHIKDLYKRIDELEAELEKAREDSKRLEKLERLMRAGYSFSAYGYDGDLEEWGARGFAFSNEVDEDGLDIPTWLFLQPVVGEHQPNIREAIDRLEEQP
jgi:hypothetical protein